MLEELEATPVLGGMAGGGGQAKGRKGSTAKKAIQNTSFLFYAGEDSDEDEEVGLWDRSSCACLALLLEAVAAAAAAAAARQRPRTSDLLQCAPKDSVVQVAAQTRDPERAFEGCGQREPPDKLHASSFLPGEAASAD